jgi:hypothetical protein
VRFNFNSHGESAEDHGDHGAAFPRSRAEANSRSTVRHSVVEPAWTPIRWLAPRTPLPSALLPYGSELPPHHPPPPRRRALVTKLFLFAILTGPAVLCQNDAMSTAALTVSDRAAQPDPTRAGARASATLNAVAVLITLVFNLIQHGKTLALAFRAHVPQPGGNLTGRFFGTAIIDVISKCMRRGVMCGSALYQVPARPRAAGPTQHDTCLDRIAAAEETGASRDNQFVPIARLGRSLTLFTAEIDRRKAPASCIETPRFGAPPEHLHPDCLRAEEQSCDHAPPQQASAECPSPEAEPCPETFEQMETAPVLHWPVSSAREVAAPASL